MLLSEQLLPIALALINAANAERLVSLSPFVELTNDYDKGEKAVEI